MLGSAEQEEHTMRWFNRITTALITLAVIVGPPLLAGAWIMHQRWPPLAGQSVKSWLQQPRTPADVIAAVGVLAAVLWLLFAGHLIRRTLATLATRWRRLQSLPLPTPAQMTAGSMAGVAALTLPAIAADHPTTTPVATTPPPADPTGASLRTATPNDQTPAGIALPGGGWVPYRTALAVAALFGLMLLNRRRVYRPDPNRLGTHHHDPDLQPPAHTVQAINTTLAADANAERPRTAPMPADHLPTGPLALHGPGASNAARGLIVAAALAAASEPKPTTALTLRHSDWNRLFPGIHIDTPLPGVHLAEDTEPIPCSADAEPTPHHVSESEEPPAKPRSTTTMLFLDDTTQPAIHWHIIEDGMATGPGITTHRRLCTLDPQAAADLIALVQQHQTRTASSPVRAPLKPTPTPTHPPATLKLLGECALTVDGQPIRLRRTAALQILTYLALHPEGAGPGELIAAIWPNLPPAAITQRLHTTLSDLRRQLQPLVGDPVSRREGRYHLNTEVIGTDLGEWQTEVSRTAHAFSVSSRANACQRMTQLYQGDLAAGQIWPWITTAREALRRDALDACIYLAERSSPEQALSWLHAAAKIDPYNTAIQQQIAISAKAGY